MNKYYYRFDEEGKLGNAMRKFWHDCIKADEAAERWAMKFGARVLPIIRILTFLPAVWPT